MISSALPACKLRRAARLCCANAARRRSCAPVASLRIKGSHKPAVQPGRRPLLAVLFIIEVGAAMCAVRSLPCCPMGIAHFPAIAHQSECEPRKAYARTYTRHPDTQAHSGHFDEHPRRASSGPEHAPPKLTIVNSCKITNVQHTFDLPIKSGKTLMDGTTTILLRLIA